VDVILGGHVKEDVVVSPHKLSVRLTSEQRASLTRLVRTGTHPAAMLRRAQILLKADSDGPDGWSDTRIGKALGCSFMTVRRVRQQFVADGLDATLHRKPPTGRQYRKLDGKQEAQLVAIACSPAPAGRARWTMNMLARRLVELEVVGSIDPATVCRTLQKTRSSLGSSSSGSSRRSRMPHSSPTWRTSSTSTPGRTIRPGRSSASTRAASS
jgi:transposase